MSLLEELKRRNVFRVAIGYVITAWLLLQFVDLVLENVNAPDWVMQVFMLMLLIGFPLAIFFAWVFEMTPDGVKRESEVDRSKSIAPQTGRKMDRNIIIAMAVALAYFAYDKFLVSDPIEGSDSISPETTQMVGSGSISPEDILENEDSVTGKLNLTPVTPNLTPASPAPSPVSDEKSVAVLPFINMSNDKENEYFSDGISEEILNVLVKVEGLRVPSRTSSFTFKGSDKKVTEIGRELQVDNVLEGSVRKSGERIRVTAQLVDVNTDTHLWSETYTRELDDIFAVQDEIAQAIVGALKVTLTGAEEASLTTRSTTSIAAYNKFLLGRHSWNQRSPESLTGAVKPLTEAVEIDPEFELAWAALADVYVLLPEYGLGSVKQYIPLAQGAIEKALTINPESAHALTTSAYVKFMFNYDAKGAHADFSKAIEIDPTYATAHQWYGELLATERKIDESLRELQVAQQLDPLAPVIPHVMGWILMDTDRKDEAYLFYQQVLDLDPYYQNTIGNLMTLDMRTGRFDSARERCLELASLAELNPSTQMGVIDAMENPALVKVAVEKLLQDDTYRGGSTGKAGAFMLLNELELAMDNLETGFANGDPYLIHLNRMDLYDPLRENPRFQALLTKMNMWP